MLIHSTVNEFIETTASSAPAPGGGSVAGLAASLAAALTSMVCRLTIGKKKYAAVEETMQHTLADAEEIRNRLVPLIDADTAAFNAVMAAFGMPKETDDQKKARAGAIESATLQAAQVPLEVIRIAEKCVPLVRTVAEHGNTNSRSDAGVAAVMLQAAVQGAALNVYINVSGLSEGPARKDLTAETKQREKAVVDACSAIAASVRQALVG